MPEKYVNKDKIIFTALLFIMIALILKGVMIFVSYVHFDTNYYLNIGSNFIERGQLTPYMWRLDPDSNIIAGSGTGYGVLILTYWLKFFGLSLNSGYALMYIVGIINLIVLFFLAKLWWRSDIAAWFSVVAFAITGRFLIMFYIRMDALGILSYSILLLVHIYAIRSNKLYLHSLVGVLSILTAEFHILGILYVVGLAIYYLYVYIQEIRQSKHFFRLSASVYFYIGAFITGIIYLVIHVLPDPQAYFIITAECPICQPPGLFKEIIRIIRYLANDPVEVLILGIALGAAFARRSQEDNHLFVLLLGCWLGMMVISPPTYGFYTMHLIPIFSLFVGGMFANQNQQLSRRLFIVVSSAIFCVLLYHFYQLAISSATPQSVPDGLEYVLEHIPEDIVVMGEPTIYHHLLEYDNFLSYRDGDLYGILLRNEDISTFWERERPLVFVGDIESGDIEWVSYMNEYNFQQVRSNVWIDGSYYETLVNEAQHPLVEFNTNDMAVSLGDCVMLEWQTSNIEELQLDNEIITNNENSKSICPLFTNTYTLSGYWVGGVEEDSIVITVE